MGCHNTQVQGQKVDEVYISVSFGEARFTAGQAYVGLRRMKSLSGLHLEKFHDKKIEFNKTALKEMERLNSSRLLTWNRPSLSHEPDESISVVHLNSRSYRAHKDLKADKTIEAAEIIALTDNYSYRILLEEYPP